MLAGIAEVARRDRVDRAALGGSSEQAAGELVWLAGYLTGVLPETLDALADGRVDLNRAQVLAEGVSGLAEDEARTVQRLLVPALAPQGSDGPGPWDGCSARAST